MSARPLLGLVLVAALMALKASPAAAETQAFANPTPIKNPASGTIGLGSPYPSSVTVNGMPGPITDVNVTLHHVGHTRPSHINVVLASPGGDAVKIMGANCGDGDIEDFTWILDQQAVTPMPNDLGTGCDEFVYRPNTFPSPAPAPAPPSDLGDSLDDFNGENPNGAWRLYVFDCCPGEAGDIENGWTLTLTTGAVDSAVPGTGSSGIANPYPATRSIASATEVITDLNVRIQGLWHQRPDDLDILLVGPHDESVVLMSDACGTFEAEAFTWVWDDEAPAPMPEGDGTNVCAATNQRPADHGPADSWPAPAPAGPHAGALSAFDLTDPNGDWRLYVNDDAGDKVGFFTHRFTLGLTTRRKAGVAFADSQVEVAEGATRELTLRRSGPAALGAGAVTVTSVPATATSAGDFTPISTTFDFAPGATERKVQVDALTDAERESAESYVVSIASASGDALVPAQSSVTVTIPATPPADAPPAAGGPGDSVPPVASVPRCGGKRATLVGTARRDVLRGTRRADVIVALGGDDVIRAAQGNDTVCGGTGNDTLSGGPGADRLNGQQGKDRLAGGAGTDRLTGGPQRDTCVGGPARDRVRTCEKRRSQ